MWRKEAAAAARGSTAASGCETETNRWGGRDVLETAVAAMFLIAAGELWNASVNMVERTQTHARN